LDPKFEVSGMLKESAMSQTLPGKNRTQALLNRNRFNHFKKVRLQEMRPKSNANLLIHSVFYQKLNARAF